MTKPRLCLVGPMIGRNSGRVTTQGEKLADHFAAAGYPVLCVSSHENRYLRFADIARTLIQRRYEIDIVVLQVFGGPSFIVEDMASWLARHSDHRVVMVLRGGGMPVFMSDFRSWTERVLNRADLLVAPSTFLSRAVRPYGYRAEVIANTIDLTAYPYRHRASVMPRLFWMRSFHQVYNPQMAVRVLARVRRKFPKATLVMAGPDGGLQAAVRMLAERTGVGQAVRFAGFLDMAVKVREFDAADIYLNTNRVDNMPVSVVEACAMGLPVVSTRVGGISDLLTHQEQGLLVRDDDDEAMAEAVVQLLEDPVVASRLSESGRALAGNCSADRVLPRWGRLFDAAMSVPAGAHS